MGFPLLVQASAAGVGGMRIVSAPEEPHAIAASTQNMAPRAFGDGVIFLERYISHARHVEVQVFGFGNGEACISSSANARCSGISRRSSRRAHRRASQPQRARR